MTDNWDITKAAIDSFRTDTIARFIQILSIMPKKLDHIDDETQDDYEARCIRAAREAVGLRDYSGNA